GVADPGNAGTLLRSAEAAGAGAVAFCDSAVDPYGPKCVRASAGSLFRLAVVRDAPVDDVLVALRAGGVTSVATVPTDLAAGEGAGAGDADPTLGAVPYDRVDLASRPVAVLLGNEAHGLHPALTVPVDRVVTIPMAGATESLNVAMAGTIVCFESLRQRRLADGGPGPANRLDGAPPRAAGCSPT
ncbi:MAG TPA: RNA methyltransferase, partial [Acidimicrobiales bacterium]